jgi:rSAM/selenodomain-associated transferase 1
VHESRPANSALIVFLRPPRKGKVKTRLAATMGPEQALDIYRRLVSITLECVLKTSLPTWLYFEAEIPEPVDRHYPFQYRLQCEGDLGEKISHALQEILNTHNRAVIIGSDCPALTPGLIVQSLAELDRVDLVIGPAVDGGYYLLACKKLHPSIFNGISWGSPAVFEQTINRCQQSGLSYSLLPVLSDIDTEVDWVNYLNETGTG